MVGSSVADEFKLLRSCLETHARGKVHPLVGILGLGRWGPLRFGVIHPEILPQLRPQR